MESISGIISGKSYQGNEYTALRKDGCQVSVQAYSSLIKDNDRITG